MNASYQLADAFGAAVDELFHFDVDGDDVMLPREPLAAEDPAVDPARAARLRVPPRIGTSRA